MSPFMTFLIVVAIIIAILWYVIGKIKTAAIRKSATIGSDVAYQAAKITKGEEYAKENEEKLRKTGATIAAVGTATATGEISVLDVAFKGVKKTVKDVQDTANIDKQA